MARKKSETAVLGFRVKEPLRRKIERAAKQNGVSMNTELVRRVETSFDREDAEASAYGGARLAALFRILGGAANMIEARTGKSLTEDVQTLFAIQKAWGRLIPGCLPPLPLPPEIIEAKNAPPLGKAPTMPKRPEPARPDGLFGEPKIDPEIQAAYDSKMEKFDQDFKIWKAGVTQYRQSTDPMAKWVNEIVELSAEAITALMPPQEKSNGE